MIIRNLLTEALWSLSFNEIGRLEKYLRSPYFKKEHLNNGKVWELFKILKSYFIRLPENKKASSPSPFVNWERIMKKLFLSDKYSVNTQKRLNKICSEFVSYILDFFAIEYFMRKKVDTRISLSHEILNRNLSSLFERCWKVKYFNGIYSEDEVTNLYHRYQLIHLANLHKEKYKIPNPDYSLELFLIEKYLKETESEIKERSKKLK